jgi:hypothetical protein
MMDNPGHFLFVLWSNARYREAEILAEIRANFRVLKEYDVFWSDARFMDNLSCFYACDHAAMPEIAMDRGMGPFLLVVVEDTAPDWQSRQTLSRGSETVNANVFDLKIRLRETLLAGKNILHSTNSLEETRRDMSIITGRSLIDWLKETALNGGRGRLECDTPPVAGWKSLSDLFYILNESVRYVVLRNFDHLPYDHNVGEHGDIDILADDMQRLAWVLRPLNDIAANPFPMGFTHWVPLSNGQVVPFHSKFVLDGYYDAAFEREILASRVLGKNGVFVPCEEMYFWSLLYHAVYHKWLFHNNPISQTYIPVFKRELARRGLPDDCEPEALKRIIDKWLQHRGYVVSYPMEIGPCDPHIRKAITDLKHAPPSREPMFYYRHPERGGYAIFHLKMLSLNAPLLMEVINRYTPFSDLQLHVLPEDSWLRHRYLPRVAKDEYMWLLRPRNGHIMESTYGEDRRHVPFWTSRFVAGAAQVRTPYFTILPEHRREIVHGRNLSNIIVRIRDREELLRWLNEFIGFVFDRYATSDLNLLEAHAWDAVPKNCYVLPDGAYEMIDHEYVWHKPIEKSYMLWLIVFHTRMLHDQRKVYHILRERLRLPDLSEWYQKLDQLCVTSTFWASPKTAAERLEKIPKPPAITFHEWDQAIRRAKGSATLTERVLLFAINVASACLVLPKARKRTRAWLKEHVLYRRRYLFDKYFTERPL